jgi:hypothetical protein
MSLRNLPSLGTVTKKERLTVADHFKGTSILILETLHPFSGYYGTTVPDNDDPMSIFLVTKHHYNEDKVIRFIQSVKKSFKIGFDAVPGQISWSNKTLGVIRVRCISQVHIGELIQEFKSVGAEFMAKQKLSPFDGLIKITKYFNTEEVEKGIFFDLDNPAMAYLQMESHLRWSSFESLKRHVMNNVEGANFDSALSTMYDCTGVLDFVRVYDEKRSPEKMRLIRNRYLSEVKKHGI